MRSCPTVRLGMQCGTAVDTARTSISLTPIPHGRWFQLAQGTGRSAPADELRSNRLSRRARKQREPNYPQLGLLDPPDHSESQFRLAWEKKHQRPGSVAACISNAPGTMPNCASLACSQTAHSPASTLAFWPMSDILSSCVTCFYLSSCAFLAA